MERDEQKVTCETFYERLCSDFFFRISEVEHVLRIYIDEILWKHILKKSLKVTKKLKCVNLSEIFLTLRKVKK